MRYAVIAVITVTVVLAACGGSDEVAEPSPTATSAPAPTTTPAPEYVRFREIPLHPDLVVYVPPRNQTSDPCLRVLLDAPATRTGEWADVINEVLTRDSQCFTTDAEGDVLSSFYQSVLSDEDWTVEQLRARESGGVAIFAVRRQGLEKLAIGSNVQGSVPQGFTRYVAIAVLPER